MKKADKLTRWQWIQIWGFVITIIIALFITNQIVQPLFSPRVTNMDITPLYIQSSDKDYYLVAKVSYLIDVPLFPVDRSINLFLPGNAQLNTQFKEDNPHITVDIFEKIEGVKNFESLKSISVSVNTDGFKNKQLTSNFYIVEKLDKERLVGRGNIGYSDNYWWNWLSISPIIECMVTTPDRSFVGYGTYGDRKFSFTQIQIRNNCDLEIKGYRMRSDDSELICDDDVELAVGDGYVSFDINPRETKRLILVKEDNDARIYNHTFTFPYSYRSIYNPCVLAHKAFSDAVNKLVFE